MPRILPISALSPLEENLTANRQPVAYLASQFDFLNHKFNHAGMRYAVVKGFSLIPQLCPDAALRHQSDFDYLVDNQSLPLAKTVLEDDGYSLKKSKANEFVFLMPSAGMPLSADRQMRQPALLRSSSVVPFGTGAFMEPLCLNRGSLWTA